MRRSNVANRRPSAFTLIELLIVITILGILAAVVVPRFSTANQTARINAMRSELQQLRKTINLYKNDHGGQLPNLVASGWDPLTKTSNYQGKTYGPYLLQTPKNLFNQNSVVVDGKPGTNATSAAGFVYDYNGGNGTGQIGGTNKDAITPFNEKQP